MEVRIARMCGRNPERPTSRKRGLPTEQRLEPLPDGMAGALTTVQKDNMLIEEKDMEEKKKYRVRKLTEKECWRLMGYKDSDYNKVAEVISACQRYKTAGNAIIKQVLMAIFLQMGIHGKKRWNDMTVEERQALVDSSLDFLGEKKCLKN